MGRKGGGGREERERRKEVREKGVKWRKEKKGGREGGKHIHSLMSLQNSCNER